MAYVSAGILTVDEVRANLGLAPLAQAPKPVAPAVKKNLRKDDPGEGDDEEDEDDESGDGGDDGDGSDAGNESDFDAAHPRWPAGSPGGIGGEFAPKDAGDATNALHDAIAGDAQSPAPLNPNSVWAALTSGIDEPSSLPQGTEVAGPVVSIIGGPKDPAEELKEESGEGIEAKEEEELKQSEQTAIISAFGAVREISGPSVTPAGAGLTPNNYITENGTLMNAQCAVIDPNKILGYSLNPDNDKGSDKAVVFSSALGYNQSNAGSLIQQLQQGVQQSPAAPKTIDQYGSRFSVDIPVTGPNGNTATVRTGWIYDPGSTTPRLITALVKK